jgi:DNA-binding response OmpR family regulator
VVRIGILAPTPRSNILKGVAMLALVAQTDKNTYDNLHLAFKMCLPGCLLENTGAESQFLNTLKTKYPDLVIVDSSLAANDGAELIKKIRQCSQVPIICLSASKDESKAVKALEGGADLFIAKPFRQLESMAYVRALIRGSRIVQIENNTSHDNVNNIRNCAKSPIFPAVK